MTNSIEEAIVHPIHRKLADGSELVEKTAQSVIVELTKLFREEYIGNLVEFHSAFVVGQYIPDSDSMLASSGFVYEGTFLVEDIMVAMTAHERQFELVMKVTCKQTGVKYKLRLCKVKRTLIENS